MSHGNVRVEVELVAVRPVPLVHLETSIPDMPMDFDQGRF